MVLFGVFAIIMFISGILLFTSNSFTGRLLKNRALSKYLGIQLILIGFLFFALAVLYYFQLVSVIVIISVISAAAIGYTIIHSMQIYREGTEPQNHAVLKSGAILLILLFLGFVAVYIISAPRIILSNDYINVRTLNGIKIHLDDMKAMKLADAIPKIVDAEGGVSVFNTYRGRYELAELGGAHLFINEHRSKFIFLFLQKDIVVITMGDDQQTAEKYNKIKEYWYHYLDTTVLNRLKEQQRKFMD